MTNPENSTSTHLLELPEQMKHPTASCGVSPVYSIVVAFLCTQPQQAAGYSDKIKAQTLLIADQTTDVENLRLNVAEITSAIMQEVADNPALKNETMRKAEKERLLKANAGYIEKSKELRAKEQTLNIQRVHLEYLHNMFAAYRSIAGMGAK